MSRREGTPVHSQSRLPVKTSLPSNLLPSRRSTLLRTPGTIVCALESPEDEDPEDPDDDLDV